MRRGLTLIELIFTMVIVAVVFTVIPKLIQSMSSASKSIIKEDAIYNTMAAMGTIISLPWDESNTANEKILHVNSTHRNNIYDCNDTILRRDGGFAGGRQCGDRSSGVNNASLILGAETTDVLDDIDDYNGRSINTNKACGGSLYDLGVVVEYVRDDNISNNNISDNLATNVKHIMITTQYDPTFTRHNDSSCMVFDYYSYNIGQSIIKKRPW